MNESALQRLVELLRELDPESATWLGEKVDRHAGDAEGLGRVLNAPRMWAGAGSVASQALKPDTTASAEQVREFRQLMIDLGEELLSGERPNSDISAWVLAFSNWNQSGI